MSAEACCCPPRAVCPFMIYGEIVQRWRIAQGAVLRKWPHTLSECPLVYIFSELRFRLHDELRWLPELRC